MTIEAIVFDLGGVLIDWNPRYLYRKLIPDEATMERFLGEICTPSWNEQQDAGRAWAEAVAELSLRHPEHADLIGAFHLRWEEMLKGPIQGTVEIFGELHASGMPLHALTNWSAETFPVARDRFAFLGRFRHILVSGEVGMKKPDRRIFELLVERCCLTPERTVFIDDAERNVAAASALGFDTIRFRDPEQLRRELTSRRLL